jgi:two-component system phosphate regulon sensor histidine kinase PhoR
MKLKRIQTKISITYILFALVILFTVALIINFEFESKIKSDIKNNLVNYIQFLEKYLEDISTTSNESLDNDLKIIAKKLKIRITLIDNTGEVLIDSDIDLKNINTLENHINRPEIISSMKDSVGFDERKSKSTGIEYFYVAQKVLIHSDKNFLANLSFIRTSISLANLQIQITEMRWKIFISGIIVLVLVLALSIVISKKISSPIMNIVRDLNIIAKGNYNHVLIASSDDEIKILANSINQLVEKINYEIQELNKLSQVRSQFLANVSHELRTPIFSIQAILETLLNGAINDKKVNKEYLQKTFEQTERLNLLLTDLIDIARIESGELKLSFRYFTVKDLIDSVLKEISPSAGKNNVKLIHNCTDEIADIKVYGDKERLFQVLFNLIDNAIKYNPQDTIVKIDYKLEDSLLYIFVEDNGVGIPQEHLPRIFERFYRIDKERSRKSGGTGLGLAIVKHIIEAHGSKVEVKSSAGKGSKFSFSLKI